LGINRGFKRFLVCEKRDKKRVSKKESAKEALLKAARQQVNKSSTCGV
jgi:hypothetical protein